MKSPQVDITRPVGVFDCCGMNCEHGDRCWILPGGTEVVCFDCLHDKIRDKVSSMTSPRLAEALGFTTFIAPS